MIAVQINFDAAMREYRLIEAPVLKQIKDTLTTRLNLQIDVYKPIELNKD